MNKKTMPENHMNGKSKALLGATAILAAAGVAGAIFLYGTDAGKKRRKEIKSWMLKMQGDVMDKMSKMKEWTEVSYADLIDTVARRYEAMKSVDTEELATMVKELKGHWKTLRKSVEGKPTKSRKAKVVKSTTSAPKPKTE